jgi:CHAT domain-containing protein
MSLWSVPDAETSALMADFYRGYLAHGDAPRAMTEAQRARLAARRAAGEDDAPQRWGAFVVSGGGVRRAAVAR